MAHATSTYRFAYLRRAPPGGSIETRSFPNSLAATLATLPSRSLVPAAPFSSTNAYLHVSRVHSSAML